MIGGELGGEHGIGTACGDREQRRCEEDEEDRAQERGHEIRSPIGEQRAHPRRPCRGVFASERLTSRSKTWRQRLAAQPRRFLSQRRMPTLLARREVTTWWARIQVTIDLRDLVGRKQAVD